MKERRKPQRKSKMAIAKRVRELRKSDKQEDKDELLSLILEWYDRIFGYQRAYFKRYCEELPKLKKDMTEEEREKCCKSSNSYYYRNQEMIKAKNLERYHKNKEDICARMRKKYHEAKQNYIPTELEGEDEFESDIERWDKIVAEADKKINKTNER